ncbi:MAG: hypothetical protein K9J16_15490 [Melioribacteraceae bacterium]|nr:hypothetical protein [Melioribacteraceae bacterium]MCF8355953.1 hypothetical protein [Melioribacteraceae bacterium]MCF8420794.1 hypothetical protein [Melioribacteraceae bacterium]
MNNLLFLILCVIVFVSCNSTEPDNTNNNYESVEEFFPLKIGNKWEYSFKTESENAIIERIIKNNIIHEDGSNIWGFTEAVKVYNPDPNEPIAGYNTFKTDGLFFYSSDKDTMFPGTTILCRKELVLKSPVEVGTEWETNSGVVCRIEDISEYNVLDKIFPNTVLVVSKINQNIDSLWYSLNIGLVKRVLNVGIGTDYQSTSIWELRDYSLL